MAAYAQTLEVNFGTAYTGLATVAYKLVKRSDGSLLLDWTTTGVSEAESGSGMYKVSASLDDGWGTRVRWRSAETGGVFAGEDVSPLGLLPTAAAVAALPTNTQMEARTLAAAGYATATALATAQGTLTKVETMIEVIP